MSDIARDVRVTGRVQGVGYRAWTRDAARGHGLSGWVRNEPDGSVRAVIAGPFETVEAMLRDMEDGPALARVERVSSSPAEPPEKTGFKVRH